METHELPTSEWDHSHALEEGDELIDTTTGAEITVFEIHDNGGITGQVWIDQRGGQEYTKREWSQEAIALALAYGIFERLDGLSHELATF